MPDPLFDLGLGSGQPEPKKDPYDFQPRPFRVHSQSGPAELSQDLIDEFKQAAGLEDWERQALEARARIPEAKTVEEAEALHKQAYEAKPNITTYAEWDSHLKFREDRTQKLRNELNARMSRGLVSDHDKDMILKWIEEEAEDVVQRRAEYQESLRKAQKKAEEQAILEAERSKARFWDQNKEDFQGRAEREKGYLESGLDWVLDAISVPVNTVSSMAYALSNEVSMGIDQIELWARDPDSEEYKAALRDYTDREREINDLWHRGGGFMGILAEWVPFVDDENSVIDLMSSHFRTDVGESYDQLYTNIDYHTGGVLTDMNEAGDRIDDFTLGIPNPISFNLRLPSLPKNLAGHMVSAQELATGYEFSAKERRVLERELTKEIAGGLLELAYDPLNVAGGSAAKVAGVPIGALGKARYSKHLAKLTDDAADVMARAKVMGILDGTYQKGGRYLDEFDEAAELGELLSKDGNQFGKLGQFDETVRERVVFGGEDLQDILSKLKDKSVKSNLPGDAVIKGQADKAPRGRSRIYEVGGETFESYDEAVEFAASVKHARKGVNGEVIRYADLTPAEKAALQAERNGALAGEKVSKEIKKMRELAAQAFSRFKIGDEAAEFKAAPEFFVGTTRRTSADDAARAGKLFDNLLKKERANLSKLTPEQFATELKTLRDTLKNSKVLPLKNAKRVSDEVGKNAQRMLKQVEKQLDAARRLSRVTKEIGLSADEARGAFRVAETMDDAVRTGKSSVANIARMLETKLPLLAKLDLQTKARWTMNVAARLGDKAAKSKIPAAIHRTIISRVPPRWRRAYLVAKSLGTSDKVQARQFHREFVEATTKRLSKYKFTAKEIEREVALARKGDPIYAPEGFGLPIGKDGKPTGQSPGESFGLVQVGTRIKDEKQLVKSPVVRQLTDEEKADVLAVVRDVVERTSAQTRANPYEFLRALENSKQGRAILERMGPHTDLVLEISKLWDEGAEFIRLFQERKGLKVAELVDDVVEGWFGRVWSEDMLSVLLENPAIREFVKNYQSKVSKRLGKNVGLSKSGQFAERSAKNVFADELEEALRKKFGLPKGMNIFAKDPGEVLSANIRLAEQQFEKLRMVQAFSDASAPVKPSRLREWMNWVREAEKRSFNRFLGRASRKGELDTEDALTRRMMKKQQEILEEGLVRRGDVDNPAEFTRMELTNMLQSQNAHYFGGGKFHSKVLAAVGGFLKGRRGGKATKNIRVKLMQALKDGEMKDWGPLTNMVEALRRSGFDPDALIAMAKETGDDFELVANDIAKAAQDAWVQAIQKGDWETIYDIGLLDPDVADWLKTPDVLAQVLGRRLDTPEGRLLNAYVVDKGHRVYNPLTDEMEAIGLSMAARPVTVTKAGRMRAQTIAHGSVDPLRRQAIGRRGWLMIDPDEGSAMFTFMHEAGHLVDNIGVLPEELSDIFAEDFRKFAAMLHKGHHREDKMPEAFQSIQEYINLQVYGRKDMPADPADLGQLSKDTDGAMRQLFTDPQWKKIKKYMELTTKGGFWQNYRVKPNEMFADTFALAMRGIYDPRLPEFSKAMLGYKRRAETEGKSIWRLLHENAAAKEALDRTVKEDPLVDVISDLGLSGQDERLRKLSQTVQGATTRKGRADRDELMEAFGAEHVSLEQRSLKSKVRFVRRVLKNQGIEPGPDETRAWDLMKKMGAKQPEDLEEIVRLNGQMIKNDDIVTMDKIFEVAESKGKVSQGMRSLMRTMQKSVLALPSGALKDTIGSMMWYWINAKNPVRSALRAMKLMVGKKEFMQAMRSGARIWRDDPVLDPLLASRGIVGRTEIEAGRLADRAGSPLQKMEQTGLIGGAVQLAGAPVDVAGAAAGKVGEKLGLAKTKPGRAIQNIFAKWKKRGRAVGQTTDMPIHFRKAQDEFWRVALYLDRMEDGFKAETAVQEVFRAFGNMNELTQFEEKYLKQWFFFYTWMRKALPRGARAFVDHPIKARMVYLATIGDVGRNEDGEWPAWLQQLGGWHVGKDEAGNPAVVNLMPGSWFQPLRDVTQNEILRRYESEGVAGAVLGSTQAMLRNAMPLWKVPVESATGIDSFTGLPIADPRGTGQKTADRAPPILAAPWVPESVKDFFGVRKVLDKDTGDLLYYRMDPTKRHFLFKPFPGVEAGLSQAGALTLADERKTSAQQYGRVLGTPVYSVPQARDEEKTRRLAKNMQKTMFREIEALDGHPLAMKYGRVFIDESSAVGRELKANATAYGERYLEEALARHRTIASQQEAIMVSGKMRKEGRELTPQEILKIRMAARNSVMPSKSEQNRIKEEGELHYLNSKNPLYGFYLELSKRLEYWAQDPADREDFTKPREGEAGKGAGASLRRLESMARRQ